ncbi:hypothetical protein MAPG_06774 [Magnaporthiopsis poae ATCC 64411]|uniref:Uncharacterized protein n=1 Tax=Magnaporthiopsis poae (strain ATCC 64411 / 73-15) TaxID=644358 RepID=A0A0C4E2Y2_MAGP6|nr:hypothetical protein MAPG_06774 [Magnaporthiopsis poae ATCC 64411]
MSAVANRTTAHQEKRRLRLSARPRSTSMAPNTRREFEASDESDDDFAGFDDDDSLPAASEVKLQAHDMDAEDEELERLVFGDRDNFRSKLFENDDLSTTKDLTLADAPPVPASGAAHVADSALFFFATDKEPVSDGQLVQSVSKTLEDPTARGDAAAWEDSDDEKLSVSLAGATRLRKLRLTEGEDVVSGAEYARRLRQQYLRLNPEPSWVKDATGREPKRRRRSSASSRSDSRSEDEDEDIDPSAMPLEEFLRDASALVESAGPRKRRKLRPETINIQKTRGIPDVHKGPVESLSFHPQHPILLSSSTSSMLHLHHISPAAYPTPNPLLTSVQVQNTPIRRAEFLYPSGDKIVFAGRRRFFHSWDLSSGQVTKISRIHGHRLEQRTVERFRLSPCGRYMAMIATDRMGGGMINVMRVGTMQWISQARLDGRRGIADFCWWRAGDGITILGKDGGVGEWNLEAKRFVGVWRDSGSTGGTVLAMGGRDGPSELGDDRWVAIGSNSGILQVYDRHDLVIDDKGGRDGDGDAGAMSVVKANPEPRRVFESLTTPITVVTFSPDCQLLGFGSIHKKDAFRLAHMPSCTLYRNWPTENTPLGKITAVAFGRQSDLLAVANERGMIRLWEIRS